MDELAGRVSRAAAARGRLTAKARIAELEQQLVEAQEAAAAQHQAMRRQDHVHADELERLQGAIRQLAAGQAELGAKLDRLLAGFDRVLAELARRAA